jgi:glutamate-1-semialdehyde 2,1-aminomutase
MNGSPSASEQLFARAQALMPGGVSSPVRAFRSVGGTPRYMTKGQGSTLTDEEGRKYIDYCLAWGPLILGHARPEVVEAVTRAAVDGLAFGTCHRNEIEMAELVLSAFPEANRVRFVVSGTEAVLTAIRLVRAHTGRRLLLKFSGCYHGHADAMLVKAGSGVATLGLAESEGVTVAQDTLVAPLGDVPALEAVFREYGSRIAGVLIEPLPANNGLLVQSKAFLTRLRDITREYGTQLVFDEVITGFRFGFHGYGALIDVVPDLTTLGKIIGGGLPVGAIVGRAELLDRLAPVGKTYQAGTMAGNPVALAAGIATLGILKTGAPYRHLDVLSAALKQATDARADKAFRLVQVGNLFWPYYDLAGPIPTQAEAISEIAVMGFRNRYQAWLDAGLYLPPSAYEVGFMSSAHSVQDVARLAEAL